MEADVYVRPIWQSEIRRGKYRDLAEELRHGTELFRDFDGGKNTEERNSEILIMRRGAALVTFLLLLCATGYSQGCIWKDFPINRIAGRVMYRNLIVADAELDLLRESGTTKAILKVRSDASGRFSFPAVRPGKYVLSVHAHDMMPLRFAFTLSKRIEKDVERGILIRLTITSNDGCAQPEPLEIPNASARNETDLRIPLAFEIDGTRIAAKPKVWFVVGSRQFRARVKNGVLVVPVNVVQQDEFGLRVTLKGNEMSFMGLTANDLNASWTIGIDNRPFEKDDISLSYDYTGLSRVYLLSIRPAVKGISTVLISRPEAQRTCK